MPLGKRIKNFIEERGIKQAFLAEQVGVSASVMSKMLAGNYPISAEDYYNICKALRVELSYFFNDEG